MESNSRAPALEMNEKEKESAQILSAFENRLRVGLV